MPSRVLLSAETIERAIIAIRGHNVLLDSDLAVLYQVNAKALNQAVKRNRGRFPADFMFQLTAQEAVALRSQIVTLEPGRGRHRKYLPYAFTEEGVAMLSSVLRSRRAVRVNVEIMRAFVHSRRILRSHAELARKLNVLERKCDMRFRSVFHSIRELMEPPKVPRRMIGFRPSDVPGKPVRALTSGTPAAVLRSDRKTDRRRVPSAG